MEDELRRRVEKHDRDLYRGNGKPALTVRMAVAEERIEAVKETVEEIKADNKQVKIMVITATLALIGEIIARFIK